jgi:site-specific recombinase XerD
LENDYHAKLDEQRVAQIRQIMRTLPQACGDFIRAISTTTSVLTRLAYAYDLRIFFTYLLSERFSFAHLTVYSFSDEKIALIDQSDLESYVEYLSIYYKTANQDSEQTYLKPIQNHALGITRKLSTLRSFFEYLYKSKRVPANVATLVPLPKVHEKPILHMEMNEIMRMLLLAQTGENLTKVQKRYHKLTTVRDYAILSLFLGTGVRVSECVGINMDDIDYSMNALLVTRKGGNQVMLYFPDIVAESLKSYLQIRTDIEALPGNENAFFLSLQKKRITQRTIQNMVKKYALYAAPLKKKLSPHKLRSTYATHLYNETGDIYLVADALGHTNVNTTRKHYASISEERRRNAARHVHLPSKLPATSQLPEEKENAAVTDNL